MWLRPVQFAAQAFFISLNRQKDAGQVSGAPVVAESCPAVLGRK
jgi:hypothetical protein